MSPARSARARINQTWRTKTTQDGRQLDLKLGDYVDYFRKDPTKRGGKDISGWYGPAKVVDLTRITRGSISIRSHAGSGPILEVRAQDVRPHLQFFVGLASTRSMNPAVCMWRQALQGILRKTAGHLTQYGLCVRDGQLRPCKANGTPSTLWHTLRELGRSQLGILDLHSVRAGHQVERLPAIDGYNRSLVVLWNKEDSIDYDIREYNSYEAHTPSLKVSGHFKRYGVIQYLWNTDFRKNPKHGRHPPTHWEEDESYYPEDNKPYTANTRYESSLPRLPEETDLPYLKKTHKI